MDGISGWIDLISGVGEMKMIEVKTADLVGAALDWAVAWAEGDKVSVEDGYVVVGEFNEHHGDFFNVCYSPSADWAQGGSLIDKYNTWPCKYSSKCLDVVEGREYFVTTEQTLDCSDSLYCGYLMEGPTALIAAMRAIVAAKLGDTVSVPAELVTSS